MTTQSSKPLSYYESQLNLNKPDASKRTTPLVAIFLMIFGILEIIGGVALAVMLASNGKVLECGYVATAGLVFGVLFFALAEIVICLRHLRDAKA